MASIKKANELFKRGMYHEAAQEYEEAKKKTPELSHHINYNLKLCKSRIGKNGGGLEDRLADISNRKEPSCSLGEVNKNTVSKGGRKKLQNLKSKMANCTYRLEGVNGKFATGWAVDKEEPGKTVVVEVCLDGKPYSVVETTTRREDVKKHFGGDGFSGYRAELSEYASFDSDSEIEVFPISHQADKGEIKRARKKFPSMLNGYHFQSVNSVASKVAEKLIHKPKYDVSNKIKTSVVMLNLNGGEVFVECVKSILNYNSSSEIIIIDHASSDESVNIIKNLGSERIKLIQRDKNYSYSASNNLGAEYASGDVIVFMNNDILLTSDSISPMASLVGGGDFGLLGIKLWDLVESDNFTLDKSKKINQHLGVHFRGLARSETIEAFELRSTAFLDFDDGVLETPAVTAAMMAVKKEDFISLGGFNESYFYGQEDVDFCLRFFQENNKKIGVMLGHGAYHIRGLSRKELSKSDNQYITNNRKVIQEEQGKWFRNEFRIGQFERPGFWNHKPLAVAMIVSEVAYETDKADFFTAKELGDAFEINDDVVVGYFDKATDYDVSGYDVVIVYIDGFDPRRLKNLPPHTVVIGWARNWFDRWCDRVWIEHYDMLYASSQYAQEYMAKRLKREVGLLRIAASNECMKKIKKEKRFESDYVFTGSYFDSPREISEALEPEKIPFNFKLYGHNWEKTPEFGKYTCGPVSYRDIPAVYASTRLVVDDANLATKEWGALNCRIYDALAAGTLCITNNVLGVKEIFDEDFPTYNKESASQQVERLLSDPKGVKELAEKYRNEVIQHHTYSHRANQLLTDVKSHARKNKIGIKISAPDFERAVTWGDYHFATSLRKELEVLGHAVRIDCMDNWYSSRSLNDNVNLVLRGLDRFKPRADQLNVLWIISHPDLICENELRDYDKVYVASSLYTEKLKDLTGLKNVETLLQASSFDVADLDPEILQKVPAHEILFIGNSRNEYRDVVRWCVEEDLPIAVYGGGWEQLIPEKYIKDQFISNELLPYYYHKAKVVLNDHWEDMRRNGFISNRIFDVAASGGCLLTDYVLGMEDLFHDINLRVYHDKPSFLAEFEKLLESRRKEKITKDRSVGGFSFSSRAKIIDEFLKTSSSYRVSPCFPVEVGGFYLSSETSVK